jgi:hypothetical protein
MIAGFERPELVLQKLAALEHERRGCGSAAHLEAIAGQESVFRAALDEFSPEEIEKAKAEMELAELLATAPPLGQFITTVFD